MATELSQDYFELFGLPPRFELDGAQLDRAYRELQASVHPDKFVNASEGERRVSMQRATHANEAYQTLKNPLRRATYLLRRRGVDPQFETNTAMPREFLLEQMAWREAIEAASDAGNADELDQLYARLNGELRGMYETIRGQLDGARDDAGAAETVRKLMFLEKLGEEIGGALEALEG